MLMIRTTLWAICNIKTQSALASPSLLCDYVHTVKKTFLNASRPKGMNMCSPTHPKISHMYAVLLDSCHFGFEAPCAAAVVLLVVAALLRSSHLLIFRFASADDKSVDGAVFLTPFWNSTCIAKAPSVAGTEVQEHITIICHMTGCSSEWKKSIKAGKKHSFKQQHKMSVKDYTSTKTLLLHLQFTFDIMALYKLVFKCIIISNWNNIRYYNEQHRPVHNSQFLTAKCCFALNSVKRFYNCKCNYCKILQKAPDATFYNNSGSNNKPWTSWLPSLSREAFQSVSVPAHHSMIADPRLMDCTIPAIAMLTQSGWQFQQFIQ